MRPERAGRVSILLGGAALAAAIAFGALAVLVATGHLNSIDSYGVDHLTPFRPEENAGTTHLESVLPYHGDDFHFSRAIRAPASAALATLLFAVGSLVLWRRDRQRAVVWATAFILAGALELTFKLAIAKPALYATHQGLQIPVGLRQSFPSGHALRACLLVGLAVTLWPFLWPVALLWLGVVGVALELDGTHALSDLTGSVLLGASLLFAVAWVTRHARIPTSGRFNGDVPTST